MVDSGQHTANTVRSEILPVGFHSKHHPGLSIEVVEFSELQKRRLTKIADGAPERPSFEHFVIVRDGAGVHTVDFNDVELVPGRMVRVRPGQVQQWTTSKTLDAVVVLARDDHQADRWFAGGDAACDLDPDLHATVIALVESLKRAQHTFLASDTGGRLMSVLWQALVIAFDTAVAHTAPSLPPAYVDFVEAIEVAPTQSRNVRDHVQSIGWSERTIRRACLDVTGLTPKQLLDQRILLEAKRILAHTEQSAASVAAELGFSEPTNFQKFFVRLAGETPVAFRARLLDNGSSGGGSNA